MEFVATMVTLFRRYIVKPRPDAGESDGQARARAMGWARDCHASGVALNLKRPQDVALVWEARV